MDFDFLIPKRPVSLQTKNRANLQKWKDYVQREASKSWIGSKYSGMGLEITLAYLYQTDPVDVDNIAKPILDALIGLIYDDDLLITDIKSHRRSLTGSFDPARLPILLLQGVLSSSECVYVRIRAGQKLEDYL